ncbi:ATP-binding protein [Embleya scabrispora]|uniref:ATP-binding protein n=1 Tax=Embleya scabrispora TaxID=159449 RepID=UPI001FDFB935|nr:ATP-binding protein [Embleya scabrispora]
MCEFEGHGYAEELARRPESAGDARRFVSTALRVWRMDHVIEDARLVATELVTNALRHAEEGPVRVSICRKAARRRVRIAVVDQSDTVPLLRAAGRDAEAGHGLLMVHELSGGCWATDLLAVGKRVRADIYVGDGRGEWT